MTNDEDKEQVLVLMKNKSAAGHGDIKAKPGHVAFEKAEKTGDILAGSGVVAVSFHDLRPEKIHQEHLFGLENDYPV